MKDGLHPWGVFERRIRGFRLMERWVWVLISHHKTSHAAAQRARSGQIICRIANFTPRWERP